MKSFKKFVEARTKGAISKKYSIDDRQYVVDKYHTHPNQITTKIRDQRKNIINALNDAGEQLFDDTMYSLSQLEQMAADKGIDFKKDDLEKKWKIFEKDVVKGIQEFLDSQIIHINDQPLAKSVCITKSIGGGLQSDVQVVNTSNNKQFFIECKLDFENARYFKYGIQIDNGKLKYDHKRYIDGKKNSDEISKIDELFTKYINLNAFMDDILKEPSVKETWDQFGKNIDELCYWLKHLDHIDGTFDKQWKQSMKNVMLQLEESDIPDDSLNNDLKHEASFLTGKYPQDFKHIENIFDKYVGYYKNQYDSLIDRLIDKMPNDLLIAFRHQIGDESFDFQDLKFSGKRFKRDKSCKSNELFQHLSQIIAKTLSDYSKIADQTNADMKDFLDEHPNISKLDNGEEITKLASELQKIETKFNALLTHLKYDVNDFSKLDAIKPVDKLKYFFKMFISSTGRKLKNDISHALVDDTKLGNMMICAPVVVENTRLAQMITDFYVKKDGCAYIQIQSNAYQFDDRHNPLGLIDMPIFKDCMTKFEVGFFMSDDLKKIMLSIKAFKPNASCFQDKSSLSFIKSHSNYICKVLKKPIQVTIK